MNDAEIFYKAINVLVDRELKVKAMTSRAIADALMLALNKLIETAPDVAQQKELRVRVCEHLERIAKGDRALHWFFFTRAAGRPFPFQSMRSDPSAGDAGPSRPTFPKIG